MFSPNTIKTLVEKGIPGSKAEVTDMTGTNDHFQLLVVAPAFEGKSLVERHRIVYAELKTHVGAEIHALSLKTLTPNEAGSQ